MFSYSHISNFLSDPTSSEGDGETEANDSGEGETH